EVLLLVGAGAPIGGLLAIGALRTFVAAAPIDLPRLQEIHPDWHVVGFGLLATILSAGLAAIVPAWRLARADLARPLASATRSATETKDRLRALDVMMIAEVALSTTVLILGSLLVASFLNVMRVE